MQRPGIVHGNLHALDLDQELRGTLTHLLSRSLGALRQHISDALAPGYFGDHLHGGIEISPLEFDAIKIFGRQNALLEGLHCPS